MKLSPVHSEHAPGRKIIHLLKSTQGGHSLFQSDMSLNIVPSEHSEYRLGTEGSAILVRVGFY